MGMVRRASVLLVVLLLSGCWLQPGFGPERQSSNPFETMLTPANVADVDQAWSAPVNLVSGGQPLVTGTGVYVAGAATVAGQNVLAVRAFAPGSGAPLWSRDLPLDPTLGRGALLSVAQGGVLAVRTGVAGTGLTAFDTLDPATGAVVATESEPGFLDPAGVAVADDVIAYRALRIGAPSSWQLVVRDRDTFDQLWTIPIGSFSLGANDPPIVDGDRLYLQDQGAIHAFAAGGCGAPTCDPLWTTPVPPLGDGLIVSGRMVTVTDDDGHVIVRRDWHDDRDTRHGTDVVALTSDGVPDWVLPLQDLFGLAVAGDTVCAVGTDAETPAEGQSATLLVRSGGSTWRADEPLLAGTPVVAGGVVYVEAADDLRAFAAGGCGAPTCSGLTTIDNGPGTGGLFGSSVTFGTLFVNKAGPNGQLIAFRPSA